MLKSTVFILLGVLILFSCKQQKETPTEDYTLGTIKDQFPVSTAAREAFNTGLLLLHSFEYDDGKDAFLAAQAADKTEVMAYWGEAMCHYRALWGLQDVPAGQEVMAKLGASKEERIAKTEEGIEREFWEGIEILFGEGELNERNENYTAHMNALYDKYPKDLEVAAFYSLSLLWADYNSEENLKRASDVAAGIIKENPTHPGALHYMIHSSDDPTFAIQAVNAANEYAKVAPDAAHALHMPSHIYVALGMWNQVVTSNKASYRASLNRIERKKLGGNERGYHSLAWQHYGYLQQGNYDDAEVLLREIIGYAKDSTASETYTIMMQNEHRIETGRWLEDINPVDVNTKKLGLEAKSQKHFFNSLLAFDNKEGASIETEISKLLFQLDAAQLLVGENGIALCSAGPTRYAPTPEGISKANVIVHQMEALLSMLGNDDKSVEMHLIAATTIEMGESYDSGPPFIAYPSFEQYGDWLLTKGRAEEALAQYDKSLENRTNRSKALRGKIEALSMLNRMEEAEANQKILDIFWEKALISMK
ncbi:MAG: tetratricopeptide (TPR) repeat protein [Cyclobacteriaceae bacterium]|jgi:tetratricopeptide (TPR) repeat protein